MSYLITAFAGLSVVVLVAALAARRIIDLMPYQPLRRDWKVAVACNTAAGVALFPLLLWVASVNAQAQLLVAVGTSLLTALLLCGQILLVQKSVNAVHDLQVDVEKNQYDKTTGAFTRKYLDQRLEQEAARSKRFGAPLAVMAVDISGFAAFNDEYGHHAGDIALGKLYRTLHKILRNTDVGCRYQADTFLVILPDTPESHTSLLETRLRTALQDMVVLADNDGSEPAVKLSMRFGIAHCTLSTRGAAELVQRALDSLKTGRRPITGGSSSPIVLNQPVAPQTAVVRGIAKVA